MKRSVIKPEEQAAIPKAETKAENAGFHMSEAFLSEMDRDADAQFLKSSSSDANRRNLVGVVARRACWI
jgi:hypothetical protein